MNLKVLKMITLFFIGLTIFLLIKLNEAIGTSIGYDLPDEIKKEFSKKFNLVESDMYQVETVDEKIKILETKIKGFSEEDFKKKAQKVFEMVFEAYSGGDKFVLQELLTPQMYKAFEMAIEDRTSKKQKLCGSLEGINSIIIKDIVIDNKSIKIFTRFDTEQVNITKNEIGEIIDGDPEFVDNIKETWVFQKDKNSNDKHWFLAEILPE